MASPSPSKKVRPRVPQPRRFSEGGKRMIDASTQTEFNDLDNNFRCSTATSSMSTGQSTFSRQSFRTSRDPAEVDQGSGSLERASTFRADAHILSTGRLAVTSLETHPSDPLRFIALYGAAPAQHALPAPVGAFVSSSGRLSSVGATGRLSAQGRPSRVSGIHAVVAPQHQGQGHDRRQALLWSAERNDLPEAWLAGSPSCFATCLTWDRDSVYTVIGGTEGGGVVLWDVRAGESPVQSSQQVQAVKGMGHARRTTAVTCTSSSAVLTAGKGGELCVWNKRMLRTPQDSLRLVPPESSDREEHSKSTSGSTLMQWLIGPTEIGMATGQDGSSTDAFYLGTDTGAVFKGSLPQISSPAPSMSDVAHQINGSSVSSQSEATSERSDRPCLEVAFGHGSKDDAEAHAALVSGLHVASAEGDRPASVPAGDLILTSSWDCSVRLWSASSPKQPVRMLAHWSEECLDVRWAPKSCSMCAVSLMGGGIELWNLSEKRPHSVAKTSLESARAGSHHMVRGANKIRFSADGISLVAGDTGGLCTLFHVRR